MTRSRRRILVLTPYPLLPPNSGGRIYALSTVVPLADEHDYHLLALANPEERAELEADREALLERYRGIFRSVHFAERPKIPAELGSRWKVLRHLAQHAWHRLPLADLSYYQPRAVAQAAEIIRRERIEVLEIHHLHCAFYRRSFPALPAVLVNHNMESTLWPFWPMQGGSPIARLVWRAFGAVSRASARAIEIDNLYRFDAKAFISPRDLEQVRPEGCPRFLLPVCVAGDASAKRFHEDRFVVLWVGGFFWPPNVEAVRWLLDEIWPALRAEASLPLELHLVGANPPDELRERHDGREVFVHGHVADVAPFRAAADACVVPLRDGGGVRIKIVEALAAGVPVVSTAKGCEGLTVEHWREVLIADTATELVAALARLMGSVAERQAMAERGRRYCLEQHSPEAMAAVKQRMYDAIL